MNTMTRMRSLVGFLALVAWVSASPAAAATPKAAQTFATPEAAADALAAAARAGDDQSLLTLFGPDAKNLVGSGDAVQDKNTREDFVKGYDEKHSLEKQSDSHVVLVYGDDDFPFPVPIVKQGEQWHFDTVAGKDEILARRVGRNELATMQVCLAYVDAQREFGSVDSDHDGLFEYAQKLISSDGKRDGLYWPTKEGEPQSPLGELVADARSEGYTPKEGERAPYHGYLYKILTKQGPNASDGAYDYVVHGHMIGGFALVAYPAEYEKSGIMTFIVNHDGVVYSKDLGPNTAKTASAMTRYDPDKTWKKEAPPEETAQPAQPQ
jgi:DUF2950 family protein